MSILLSNYHHEFLAVMDENATFWHGINCIWKRRVSTIHFRQKVIFDIFDFFSILAYIFLSVIDNMVPFYTNAHIYLMFKLQLKIKKKIVLK